jgi:hypothetical protein
MLLLRETQHTLLTFPELSFQRLLLHTPTSAALLKNSLAFRLKKIPALKYFSRIVLSKRPDKF